jgi:hypothetical protein
MVSVNVPLAAAELASVTVTMNAAVPAAVGVPVIAPAEERERPGGSAPRASDQEYGAAPPVAARVCEYGAPTAPAGKVGPVTVSAVTAIVSVWLAVADVESVTVTVKVEVTAAAVRFPAVQILAVGIAPVVTG